MDNHQLNQQAFVQEKMKILSEEELDRLKNILVGMLSDFHKFADKYNITYTMSGGSAIGAVRHHGFIPWDDDIDINIPRADYKRVLEFFPREFEDRYILCSPEHTSGHGMLCAQIKKKGTIRRSFNELSKAEEDCGIAIDIFVIENTFDNVFLRRLHGYAGLAFGYLSTCRKTYHDLQFLEKYMDTDARAADGFKRKAKIGRLFRWISLDASTRMANTVYSLCKNDDSRYVTIPGGRGHFFKEMQRREDLCETIDMVFEGLKIKVPRGYDVYMTKLYGDYMTIPDREDREKHPLMEIVFDIRSGGVAVCSLLLDMCCCGHSVIAMGGAA